MRTGLVLVNMVVLPLVYGCDGMKSPTQPSPSVLNAPAPAPMTGPAELTISDVSLGFSTKRDGLSLYWVRFNLNEISGRSGAVIKSVMVSAPGADTVEVHEQSWLDWGIEVRVYAGHTTDAFGPKGAASQSYSAPLIRSRGFPQFVVITVRFVDDTGKEGAVVSQFDLTPPDGGL